MRIVFSIRQKPKFCVVAKVRDAPVPVLTGELGTSHDWVPSLLYWCISSQSATFSTVLMNLVFQSKNILVPLSK